MTQRKWLKYVKDYDCSIEYTAGKKNSVADALHQKYTGLVKRSDNGDRV